ncbi:MAG: hypothetical protein J1E43_11725 [Christensenellaceae bacterium]|nr:hypothetical protein [Christensenellaceae bacterium]
MLALLMLYLLLITPVTLRLDLRLAGETDVLLAARLWGLGPNLRFRLRRTEQGHRVFRVDKKGRETPLKAAPSPGKPAMTALRTILRGDHARQLLFRGITLLRLDAAVNVSLGDAARTALTAGTLQSLWRALPCAWRRRARLQVRPDFLNGRGSLQARCIVFFHLGTLILTAALLLLSLRMERSAHPAYPAKEA